MLKDEARQEIETERARYHTPRSACIDALRIVQNHHGWVSDEYLDDIAQLLDMPASEVERVATFYDMIYQHPVGRHVVLMCDSVSCHIMGCAHVESALLEKLGIRLGQTTGDDRFTVLPVACLGYCHHAPALMIDEDLHGDVGPDGLDELLEDYS